MMTEVLVLHPPTANLASTLRPLRNHQSRRQRPRQAPPLEVDEQQLPSIALSDERGLDLAS